MFLNCHGQSRGHGHSPPRGRVEGLALLPYIWDPPSIATTMIFFAVADCFKKSELLPVWVQRDSYSRLLTQAPQIAQATGYGPQDWRATTMNSRPGVPNTDRRP